MEKLDKEDLELLQSATDFIVKRCDDFKHTVGSAVRTSNGKIYVGMNMDGIISMCGEKSAISSAYIAGDTDITEIVSVGLFHGKLQVLPPCGNCRQFINDYAPKSKIIIPINGDNVKVTLAELLPYAYVEHVHTKGSI